MLENAKALVVVLVISLVTLRLVRPVAVQFMQEATFRRRSRVWLGLTVVAFLSPTFWIFAGVAFVVLAWAARRDANPLGVFCWMAFVVPHVSFAIPSPFVNQLFALTPHRILSLAILIPAVLRLRREDAGARGFRTTDAVFGAFVVLQIVTLIPYETVTHTMRRTVLLMIDSFVVLYAFSRIGTRERLADAMACFWIAAVVMAPMAVFESLRGWLLYTNLADQWGDPNRLAWLLRSDSLRAQVAANHSINFGYHMAVGLVLYLYLRTRRGASRVVDLGILGVMGAAIIVSYSRGAWVTAAAGVLLFGLLRPDAVRRIGGLLAAGTGVFVLMLVTPLKEKVLARLPFVGTEEQGTIEYRQRLSETSWDLVNQNPLFGDPFVILKMESLRQGQGMIDIVNGYLFTALFNGYVGLGLLCSVFALSCLAAYRAKAIASLDEDRLLVASLLAAMGATLIYVATAGHGTTTLLLCGFLVSAGGVVSRTTAGPVRSPWRSAQQRHA